MLGFLGTIAVLLGLIYVFFFYLRAIREKKGRPPGPLPLPLIGHDYLGFGDMGANFKNLHRKYGPVIEVKLLGIPTISIADPDIVRETARDDAFVTKPFLNEEGLRVLGMFETGVGMNNNVPLWKKTRSLLLTAVNSADFLDRASIDLVEIYENRFFPMLESKARSGEVTNMRKVITDFLAKLQQVSVFNNTVCLEMEGDKFYYYVSAFFEAGAFYTTTPPFLYSILEGNHRKALAEFYRYLDEMLAKRKTELQQLTEDERINAKDFVAVVLREAAKFSSSVDSKETGLTSDGNIRELVNEVIMGSTETIVNTLCMLMWHLAHNDDAQEKLRAEIKEFLRGNPRPGREDLYNLPVLEAVISETFRYGPPANIVLRSVAKDTTVGGYPISKRSTVFFCVERMLHNEEFISDPEVFDIERFLSAKHGGVESKHMFTFGIGRRMCPGQSFANLILKLYVIQFFGKFKIRSASANPDKLQAPYRVVQTVHEDSTKVYLELA
jgi:cytochrome P450